jgi:hypothetical protein
MCQQRLGLVLSHDIDLKYTGIDEVTEDEVDQAVNPAEGDSGFGAVFGQGVKAFPLATGEYHSQDFAHVYPRGQDPLILYSKNQRHASPGKISSLRFSA